MTGLTHTVRLAVLLGAGLLGIFQVERPVHHVAAPEVPVTYNQHIAPILYQHCTSCHHDGGSGPFSLTNYAEAKRWSGVMESATQSRYMPPWLPSGPHDVFQDDRRLPAEEIASIKRWVQTGMAEGDAKLAAKAPDYASGWQLGPPDLVLEMDEPVSVPASGTDLFRNFILPVSLKGTRWVRAMEIMPGSAQVVHHANLSIDRTASLRRRHPDDWKAGIPGMDVMVDAGENFDPDSHFLYWKPDSSALVEAAESPWRLDPGNDLVLNMHLKPTGKPETVRAKIGLYFTDTPATQFPMLLQLEDNAKLDIPPGQTNFAIEDHLKLPEDVDLLAIYPHAHYLGKRLEGWAELPDGRRKSLILIESWDIDRQAVYRYAKPIFLPAKSVVHMRYTYDNSAANPHNPNSPPIEVKAGNRSADEMGHLWLQVLPRAGPKGEGDLRAPLLRAWMEHRLEKDPRDPIALFNVASLDMSDGQYEPAAELFRRATLSRPSDARTMTALASALSRMGQWQQALETLGKALTADPTYADAHFDMAVIYLQHGAYAVAEQQLRAVVAQHPDDAKALATLGGVLLTMGRPDEARVEFGHALTADPQEFDALYNLALIELDAGQLTEAFAHLKTAETVNPKDADVHHVLAAIDAQKGQLAEAIKEQQAAIAAGAPQADWWKELSELHRRNGELDAAKQDLRHAESVPR